MAGILARALAIIMTPQSEWRAVAREPPSLAALFAGYVAILAAIPPLAHFVGATLIGGYTPLLSGLASAVLGYVASFAIVYLVAQLADWLAPSFGARRNRANALRLAAYSFTPVWIAGLFLLVPGASFLSLLGLHGAYLMWIGMPVLMQAPSERAIAYTAAIATGALALNLVVGVALALMFGG